MGGEKLKQLLSGRAVDVCILPQAGQDPDYYSVELHILFNAMTDALRKLEAGEPLEAARLLMEAQRRTEELYIEA